MNKKQRAEIEVLDYFGLKGIDYSSIRSVGDLFPGLEMVQSGSGMSPEEAYFLITSQGVKSVETTDIGRLRFLLDAKRWVMRTCDLYEEDILEGVSPYYDLLEGIPYSVAGYLSKKLFRGFDKSLIMRVWSEVS